MSAKVIFHSYVLDGKIKFDKASNGADTASFLYKKTEMKNTEWFSFRMEPIRAHFHA